MKSTLSVALSIAAMAMLSACGGGGSSGGGVNSTPTPPPAQFTSFSNVAANTTNTISGSTREGTLAVSSTGTIPVNSISTPTEGTGTVRWTVDGQRATTSLSVAGTSSSVSFNTSSTIINFYDSTGRFVAQGLSNSTGSDQAIYAEPSALGFDYQSFGVWGSGLVAGSTGRYGAISAGAPTSASAVPTSGSVNFNGVAGGIYVDPNGTAYRYGAYAVFAVNFGSRSINMTTNSDSLVNINTEQKFILTTPITANMTYAAGSNRFSGSFQLGSAMSGAGSGQFYGPAANELGGTFFISGNGGKLIGGFGGKR